MLRHSVAAVFEVAEISSFVFTEYVLSSAFTEDVVGSLCSVDQALFFIGFRKPMQLAWVAQRALWLRLATKMFQSLVVGCFCVGPSEGFLHRAVQYYFTNPQFQCSVFEGFYVTRLMCWLGRLAAPRRLKRMYTFFSSTDADAKEKVVYAAGFRETAANDGVVASVVASNIIVDVASVLADQFEWGFIYYNEVFLKWRQDSTSTTRFATLLHRTAKSHVASSVMSSVEIGLQWGTRMLGKAVAKKIFPRHSINSVPSFWVEHILLCLTAPILARLAHVSAGITFRVLETYVWPRTEDETQVDDDEAEAQKDEETDHRDHLLAATNTNDLYAALGVENRASPTEIKKAYRQRALQYHPDRVGHLDPKEKEAARQAMSVINEAYEVLSCDSKRAAYDASRTLAGSPFDPEQPHPLALRFLRLPFPIQVISGVTILTSMAWIGGLVFYAHVKTHFLALAQPGRAPVRHMCTSR